MNYWLLKSEPDDYAFDDLVREKRTVWDGVSNNQALLHLRAVKRGDRAFIYHTGAQKAIVGIAKVVRGPYADPAADDDKRVVIDVAADLPLASPVPLARIRGDEAFAEFELVRNSRLSVMPVSGPLWRRLVKLGGL